MPTKNPRLNITLEKPLLAVLSNLAEKEHKSVSNLAKELLLEALERHEDEYLSKIADKRDVSKAKRIKHTDVWK